MEQNIDKQIKKQGFEKGLLLGVIMLALGISTYYFIVEMAQSIWAIATVPILTSYVIPIVIAVFLTLSIRKSIGGYWDFRKAVTGIFIMFLTSQALLYIGRDVLFAKLIEPQMVDKMSTAIIGATTNMLEKNGLDQAKIDDQMAQVEKQFEAQKNPTIGNIIEGIIISIIMVFVLSVLFAAIFKREQPRNGLDTAIDPTVE